MKRLLTITLITLFISGTGFAQINKGITGGVNLPNLSVDPSPDGVEFENYQGMVGGIFLELDLLGPIDFQAEVLYSQKGTIAKIGDHETKARLNYILIPVLIKFKMPVVPTLGLNLQGGAYLGKKIGETIEPDMGAEDDVFENSDMGAIIGVGVQFKAFVSDLRIEARYSMGFTNIGKEEGDTIKNKNMMVLIGIGL
ncbi:PorT family protein [candidate division KSB1 bacterium]|nr:PorT family protein [candidate division KSB1 bacterium]